MESVVCSACVCIYTKHITISKSYISFPWMSGVCVWWSLHLTWIQCNMHARREPLNCTSTSDSASSCLRTNIAERIQHHVHQVQWKQFNIHPLPLTCSSINSGDESWPRKARTSSFSSTGFSEWTWLRISTAINCACLSVAWAHVRWWVTWSCHTNCRYLQDTLISWKGCISVSWRIKQQGALLIWMIIPHSQYSIFTSNKNRTENLHKTCIHQPTIVVIEHINRCSDIGMAIMLYTCTKRGSRTSRAKLDAKCCPRQISYKNDQP